MKILFLILITLVFVTKLLSKLLDYQTRNALIPENVKDVYDEKEYLNWKNYQRDNLKLATIQLAIGYLVTMLLFGFNFHQWLFALVAKLSNEMMVQYLLIFLVLGVIGLLYKVFFDLYKTFIIEEKYGFNKTTLKLFIRDNLIKFVLFLFAEAGIMTFLNKIYLGFDNIYLFLVISLAVAFFFIIIGPFLFKLISKLFNKTVPLEDGSLKDKIIEYTTKVNFPIANIYVIDASKRSKKANAYFTGYGRKRRIVLFDTLIEQLSETEIVAVLAHEAGHAKYRHLLKLKPLSLLAVLLIFIGIYMLVSFDQVSRAFGFFNSNFLFAALLFFELFPLLAIFTGLLTNSISRRFEYQADNYAAKTTSKEAMVSALKTLSRNNLINLTPHPINVLIFASHPPLFKRVASLKNTD